MALFKKRLVANQPGDFYVDSTCIDCDTCRWMAPEIFNEKDGKSRVHHQPTSDSERLRALMALVACPTASIGTVEHHPMAPVFAALPTLIAENVYHCAFHSESSFGAAPYLILRPEGNIMIDSPRFATPLVKRIEELGGIKMLFLTHGDDVAAHQKFHDHFGCTRILHADDVRESTRNVEIKLEGIEPIPLDHEVIFIPVPGHTKGSTCLLYNNQFLFTGDHAAWNEETNHVYAFRSACWYDWETQRESMKRLLQYRFEWILPGHGWRCHYSAEQMAEEIQYCVEWMGEIE